MKNIISVVIVNWNKKKYLSDCLKSLYLNKEKFEVIVVDNGSSDGSVQFVKRNYPKIKLIENDKNLGFAQANNQGFNIAKGNLILFLNNDTLVTKGFLKPLVTALQKNKIGGVQSKILLMEDSKKLDSIGAFFTNSGFLYHYGFRKPDISELNKEIDLFSAKGACMLFRKEVLEKILVEGEVFDSRYFAYFEETDLCHRVWLTGFKIKYVPDSVIYHKVGATSSKMGDSFMQYHSFKNRIDSYIKNLDNRNLLKVLPIHFLLCIAAIFSYITKGELHVSLAIIKGIFWDFLNLPSSLKKRKIIQERIRKIRDETFLPGLTKPIGIDYFIAHLKGLEKYRENN